MELGTRRKAHNFETLVSDSSNVRLGSLSDMGLSLAKSDLPPKADARADIPHVG